MIGRKHAIVTGIEFVVLGFTGSLVGRGSPQAASADTDRETACGRTRVDAVGGDCLAASLERTSPSRAVAAV